VDNRLEIADFLRHLMQRGGEPCRKACPIIRHEHRANGQPTQQVVQAVGGQEQGPQRAHVCRGEFVAVMPFQ
jgi:hypothetical protein